MKTNTRWYTVPFRAALACLLLVPLLANCGGVPTPAPTPVETDGSVTPEPITPAPPATTPTERKPARQSIHALAGAASPSEAEAAIREIVGQGFSLGLLDEQGSQLNPNVGEEAISLTPDDVAAYAMVSAQGHYRTIDYVVDFLAHIGLSLDTAGRPITTTDLLPDLQAYVDKSLAHPDDPESALGLLLAAGPELAVPDVAPQLEGSTRISPLAGLLLLADLLVGLEQQFVPIESLLDQGTAATIKRASIVERSLPGMETAPGGAGESGERASASRGCGCWFRILSLLRPQPTKPPGRLFSKQAAPPQQDLDNLIVRVKGLVTVLEYTLNNPTVQFLALSLPEKMQEQISNIRKNLGVLKALIAIYETADHFAVRTVHMDETRANYLDLKKTGSFYPLESRVVAIVPGSGEQQVKGAPFAYYLHLLSPYEATGGGPLFEDADAVLVPLKDSGGNYRSDLNGHRLRVIIDVAKYDIEAKDMRNEEEKTALLFASAKLPLDRIGQVLKAYKGTIKWLAIGVTAEELIDMVNALARDIQPLPTMSIVTFKAQEEIGATPTAKDEPSPQPKQLHTLSGHSGAVSWARFSPDGARLISISAGEAFLWDADTGERLGALEGAQDTPEVIWSSDGQMLAGTSGAQAKVWQADTGQVARSLEAGSPSGALDWSPDASRLAVGRTDGSTAILDAATGELVSTLAGHSDRVRVVQWSPDGAKLVTAAGEIESPEAGAAAIVWDISTGEPLYTLEGYESATWSPDGSQLALWSEDAIEQLGTGIVVDAATGEVVVSEDGIAQTSSTSGVLRYWIVWWQGHLSIAFVPKWDETQVQVLGPKWMYYLYHEAPVVDLSGSADGSMIVCGLADGTVVYWTVEEAAPLLQ